MARALLALVLAALLAGCAGADPPVQEPGPGPDVDATGGDPAGAPRAPTAPAEPALALRDCWSIRTSMPVDHASAQALLPADLTAASWIGPGDETFGMVDLLAIDCAEGTFGAQDSGPTSLLFVEIPLEMEGEQSGSNVFPVLVVHSNPAAAAFWDGKWPAQEGTLARTSGPDGTSTLLAITSGPITGVLEVKVPDALGGASDGSFRQLFGGPEERREVVAELDGQLVGLGGSAEFTGTGLPLPSVDGVPLTASAGLAVANGPLDGVTFALAPPA